MFCNNYKNRRSVESMIDLKYIICVVSRSTVDGMKTSVVMVSIVLRL